MKKFTTLFILLATILLLTSCGLNNSTTEQAEIDPVPKYTADELDITSNQGKQGIYVMNGDGTFSPLVKQFDGFAGLSKEDSYTRYLWFTENTGNILNTIPHFTKDSKLVLLYNTEDAIPDEFVLEKYDYKGYTIGAHIYRTEDSKMYLSTKGTLSNTYASNALDTLDDEESYLITEINESANLPFKNVDNNLEMLLGLEGGKAYQICFYKGTKYRKLNTMADAQVFQSAGTTRVQTGNYYDRTNNGYFVINMPNNIEKGYYYVTGLGMIFYEGN